MLYREYSHYSTKINPGEIFSGLNKTLISNPYSCATQCRRPKIFQIMNSDESNNARLKYQRFTPLGVKGERDLAIWVCGKISILFLLNNA